MLIGTMFLIYACEHLFSNTDSSMYYVQFGVEERMVMIVNYILGKNVRKSRKIYVLQKKAIALKHTNQPPTMQNKVFAN